jgi:transposase
VAQVEPKALLGDKGYDADSLINSLEVRAIKAVIPPKSNRKVKRDCDFALYAERNLVERFFNTIKHYRGIATRYERPPETSSPACTSSARSPGSNDDRP